MKMMQRHFLPALVAATLITAAFGQTPAAPPPAAQRVVLWVTSNAWPDGGVIPMHNAAHGDNKSPDFEFHWNRGTSPATAPDDLKSYAIILHDVQNSSNKTTTDTLHWSAFNIPGSTKGLTEGLGEGDLPDGTRNGPALPPAWAKRLPTSAPAQVLAPGTITSSNSTLLIPSSTFPPTPRAKIS